VCAYDGPLRCSDLARGHGELVGHQRPRRRRVCMGFCTGSSHSPIFGRVAACMSSARACMELHTLMASTPCAVLQVILYPRWAAKRMEAHLCEYQEGAAHRSGGWCFVDLFRGNERVGGAAVHCCGSLTCTVFTRMRVLITPFQTRKRVGGSYATETV